MSSEQTGIWMSMQYTSRFLRLLLPKIPVNMRLWGFENTQYISTGLGFGAEAENVIVKEMPGEYEQFLDGKSGTIGCPVLNTRVILKHGLRLNGQKQMFRKLVYI